VTGGHEDAARAGRDAETAACRYLEERGMEIVGRNFRGRGGEIDVIAKTGNVLVFVEVRYRETEAFGSPEESIELRKRRRIASAARAFLAGIPPSSWKEARFDVIAVTGGGRTPTIRHYPNAFDAGGKLI
jgi:putative endonuclease